MRSEFLGNLLAKYDAEFTFLREEVRVPALQTGVKFTRFERVHAATRWVHDQEAEQSPKTQIANIPPADAASDRGLECLIARLRHDRTIAGALEESRSAVQIGHARRVAIENDLVVPIQVLNRNVRAAGTTLNLNFLLPAMNNRGAASEEQSETGDNQPWEDV